MRAAAVAALVVAGALIAATGAATGALAQARRPAVEGVWSYETDAYNGGCRMSGQLVVRPASRSGRHSCTLVAVEVCGDLRVRAEQTCTVSVSGDQVSIESAVRKVTPELSYAPDNFSLKLESPQRMTGRLESFATAPARFTRPTDVPVS